MVILHHQPQAQATANNTNYNTNHQNDLSHRCQLEQAPPRHRPRKVRGRLLHPHRAPVRRQLSHSRSSSPPSSPRKRTTKKKQREQKANKNINTKRNSQETHLFTLPSSTRTLSLSVFSSSSGPMCTLRMPTARLPSTLPSRPTHPRPSLFSTKLELISTPRTLRVSLPSSGLLKLSTITSSVSSSPSAPTLLALSTLQTTRTTMSVTTPSSPPARPLASSGERPSHSLPFPFPVQNKELPILCKPRHLPMPPLSPSFPMNL